VQPFRTFLRIIHRMRRYPSVCAELIKTDMSTLSNSSLPRLLVIDDESGICLAVSLLLQDLFQVVTAETAEEGLARLTDSYALILLDLRMPGVVGFDLLETILSRVEHTPVAILSATGDRRTYDEVLQRGAVALIEKPFSRLELVTKIQQILAVPAQS